MVWGTTSKYLVTRSEVPVIVEKAPKARVDLDKRKYLVPSGLIGNALSLPVPFLPEQSLGPSCVHVIVGLRGVELRKGVGCPRELGGSDGDVIVSSPLPISFSFSHCCRALFDL